MSSYFEMKNLSVGYQGKALIRDINLEISKGEIVTLIGPNGSGKSTILKTITQHLKSICGTILLDGQDLSRQSYKELSKKMAVVLTERMKPELMTCYDMVATGRYPYTGRLGLLTKMDEAKVYEALRAVHALDIANRDYSTISDGQRQRILLARAICQEPELIVLDEPTSFLDVRHKLELLTILRKMAKEKQITVIMSLHEIDLAEKISDKILCIKGERIAHFGRPEKVFDEKMITDLYDLDNGYFDARFGSVELQKVHGEPKVFVISSSGNGIPVYRSLQKAGIPFAAGILYKNDVDYQLARFLAAKVICEEPFKDISDAHYEAAQRVMAQCLYVIDAGVHLGSCNKRIQDLIQTAKENHQWIKRLEWESNGEEIKERLYDRDMRPGGDESSPADAVF